MAAGAGAALPAPDVELRERWAAEQDALASQLVAVDDLNENIAFLGGVDISFVKDSAYDACASLVVLARDSLEVVYERFEMIRLTEPYISGFLAFREVQHLQRLVDELREARPGIFPDLILVDGNGMLHPRGFGLASHLGVLCDVPTIGIGKSHLVVDGVDLKAYKDLEAKLYKKGDTVDIIGESGRVWGALLRTSEDSHKTIAVSIGHKISLSTAVDITLATCIYRIPEPVRQADLRSRDYLRERR